MKNIIKKFWENSNEGEMLRLLVVAYGLLGSVIVYGYLYISNL